ncbi:hypothetical protein, partial [Nocardia gamkensis]|uniref:hypothetical protein n=1 Tax=Nocardia gamkensis TaxID=352869 RepID=UPI001C252DD2
MIPVYGMAYRIRNPSGHISCNLWRQCSDLQLFRVTVPDSGVSRYQETIIPVDFRQDSASILL